MGITYQCINCKKQVEFPNCENADVDKFEKLAFAIYSIKANEQVCSSKCFDEHYK